MSRARATTAALLAILLAEPTLARPVDADAGAYRPHHHHYRHHLRHHSRHHSIRVHSDPPGVKWTELPAEPTPEPTPAAKSKPSGSFVLVRTVAIPATPPIFEPRRLIPPSLPAITPASARAYCIAHGLECAGGASAPPLSHIPQ